MRRPKQPTLTTIVWAVNKCTTLQDHFGCLKEEVILIRQDLQKIRERTTAGKSIISNLKDKLSPLIRETQANTRLIKTVDMQADDLENRMRHNNVRIVGLPEKVEGRDPTDFVEQWLTEIFGKKAFTTLCAIERAHRVPLRPLPPRPMLARLLHYKDREIILRLAREKHNSLMEYGSPSILTFLCMCRNTGPDLPKSKGIYKNCRPHTLCSTLLGSVLQHGGKHISLKTFL